MAAHKVLQQQSDLQTRRHGFSRYRELGQRLHRLRNYFSQMFEPYLYTPDGFRLAKRQYAGPQDTINLPPGQKRTITICNLFSNEHKKIDEIARLLDTDRRAVILALIQEGLVVDRRGSSRKPRTERRQTEALRNDN
jgi:hypothetical protein